MRRQKRSRFCHIYLLIEVKLLFVRRMELAKKLKIPDVLSSISNKEAIDRQNIEFFTRIGEVDRKIGGIRRFFRIKKIPGIRLHQMAMREEGKFEKLMKIFRDSAHVTVMADGYMELYTGVEMGR